MPKRKSKIENKKLFPKSARRVMHPTLGRMCWLIEGKYYLTRNDYLNPPQVKGEDGRVHIAKTNI